MFKHALILCSGLVAASQAAANDLYIDLSNDTFHARFDATHASNNIRYSAETLITEDQGYVVDAGMWTYGDIGSNKAIQGGLGGKIYYGDTDNDAITALALGGTINIAIPGVDGLSISSDLFFAPSITVNNDFKNLSDFNLRVNWALFENAAIYGGLRQLEADYKHSGSHEFDEGLHAGIKMSF
ncbi:YfaZ family outer membrane protein [Agaribacterium sp. ZY112]|uniref:YfaZ family outer membrane protein n=1 Tax=Agaribacterium sp. ZY112 TaxID=3233574 RepID=UPI0035268525